ncbi:MAG: DUF885 domain-containing protein [candidate division Zixibacteria bacterium]|nr:DUF885 domain-containing protein [candidate division Zixibacteria bacterium]
MRRYGSRSAATLLVILIGWFKMSSAETPNELFNDYWEFQMRQSPTWATELGDHRYDSLLPDMSLEAVPREAAALRSFQARLDTLRKLKGSARDTINAELFGRELSDRLEDLENHWYLMPVSQQGGPQIGIPELVNYHPLRTVGDCENFVTRLQAFPTYVDQLIARMRQGMKEHLVPAKITIEKALPQIEAHVVDDPQKSVLAAAIGKIDSTIPENERQRLSEAIRAAIQNDVVPGYDRLARFVRTEYLPACRDTVGILALPDGKRRYRALARQFTTTQLTPEQIFQLGQKQLAEIQTQMRQLMEDVGFKGTLVEFAESLRHSKEFFHTSADSLVEGFKTILKHMDEKLPLLFGHLPKAPYSFKVMEPYRAESAPDAYYYPAPEDRSRPAYFYINTFRPEMRPKYTMEALAYHEAVPGHHLQIAIQQELGELPQFRRHGGYTAFVEGWALYSEELPKEVGMYSDPYSEFGRLTFDAWRAVRLVVDPGIHYFGWTRDEAIKFFQENTALSDLNIVSEVERYIAWPGQALAYKVGQLKIQELRVKTERALGDQFDVRAFHDELLSDGALPLDLLEQKMDRWLESQKK